MVGDKKIVLIDGSYRITGKLSFEKPNVGIYASDDGKLHTPFVESNKKPIVPSRPADISSAAKAPFAGFFEHPQKIFDTSFI